MKKFKILIVDDDINMIRDVVHILIKNPEYEIMSTGNGKSACEIATAEMVDLIIMDWQMPIMNGIEATIHLKQDQSTEDIPIIITSGIMVDSAHLNDALISGAVDYLRKPFDEIELCARVTNMLKLSKAYFEIQQQKRELENQLAQKLISIQQLNELKLSTLKQLLIIKEQVLKSKNQQIDEALIKMESQLYSKVYQINWNDFESHFDFVHHAFLKKIQNEFGSFTPNELRLCAFIKLAMSNKEISTITYTSPDSVNTARKRLKKKLGLLPHQSLQLFIQNM
ncbi:MAG: response regulator [Paludibacter sp.]|nr:response regulator [Paludibacter sp.]